MKDEIVKPETLEIAKSKGFVPELQHDYETNAYLDLVTTQSLLMKWLREIHEITIVINFYKHDQFWAELLSYKGNRLGPEGLEDNSFLKYEDALEFALNEALKLI